MGCTNTPMIKIRTYLINPFIKLFRAIAAYGYAHSFLFRLLAHALTVLFRKIRRRHLIIILIALIIINARSDYWRIMLKETLSLPRSIASYVKNLTPANTPQAYPVKINVKEND